MLVFPGHHEYVTTGEYDAVEGFRDLGGSLVMLSADNFFWRIDLQHGVMTRIAKWRELGRPEAALLGVQYIGTTWASTRRLAPPQGARDGWLFARTGSSGREGSRTQASRSTTPAPSSPRGTQVIGELPNLLGPGMTGQMTYYSTSRGAQVFSAGAFTLAGSIRQRPVAQLLENIWDRFVGIPQRPLRLSDPH